MQTPLVSIIIPTYNRAHLIGETLDSVLAQTYTNWECIVVDDGSSDNTEEILLNYCKKDTRFQYHHRPNDRLPGGNAARNYGFELSKGEFIQFLDSDDIILRNKLTFQLEKIRQFNKEGAVCNAMFFNNKVGDIKPVQNWTENIYDINIIENLMSQNIRWSILSGIWKRKVIDKIKWEESLNRGQEWIFHIKISLLINQDQIYFSNNNLGCIRRTVLSKTMGDSLVIRYRGYLIARVLLLRFLRQNYKTKSEIYFRLLYNPSIKYIRVLLIENYYSTIMKYSKLIMKISFKRYMLFFIGCFFYKFFRINYFLKKVSY